MKNIAKQIGQKLKEARQEAGYTQEEMADLLGLSQVGYSGLERGRTLISIEYLLQLPRILEKPITYFLPDSAVSSNEKTDPALDPLYQEIATLWTELDRVGREFVRNATRAMHDRISALRGIQPPLRLFAEDTPNYTTSPTLDQAIAEILQDVPFLEPLFIEAKSQLPEHAVRALIYNVQIWIKEDHKRTFTDFHRRLGELLTQ